MNETRELSMEEMERAAGGVFMDEERVCRCCGKLFMVTAAEQEYYADHGKTASEYSSWHDSCKA